LTKHNTGVHQKYITLYSTSDCTKLAVPQQMFLFDFDVLTELNMTLTVKDCELNMTKVFDVEQL